MASKGYRATTRQARRLIGLVLLCLSAVSVAAQENVTVTPADIATADNATTPAPGGQAGTSDVMLTSSTSATPGRTAEGNVTEIFVNTTGAPSTADQVNSSDVMMTSVLPTTEAMGNVTGMLVNTTDTPSASDPANSSDVMMTPVPPNSEAMGNVTELLVNTTDIPSRAGPANSSNVTAASSLPVTERTEETDLITEIVTETENVTEDNSTEYTDEEGWPASNFSLPKPERPPHVGYSVPILIFGALLCLLVIMIFTAVIASPSRMKRTISTYNLTTSDQAGAPSGYRNTAYEQGDLADDASPTCSMQEMRLNGKTTNGEPLKSPRGLEEELTAL